MANRDKRHDDLPDQGARRPRASRSSRPRAPPRCCAATASRRPSCASTARAPARAARRPPSQLILDGEIDLVINTPHGPPAAARRGSTATRSAPPRSWPTSRASPPCRGSAPPCRASRRSSRGDIGVRSLQDWARRASVPVHLPSALRPRVLTPDRRREGAPRRPSARSGPRRPVARARRRTPGGARCSAHGADLPERARAWPRASTRTRSASTRWPALGFGHVEIGTVTGEAQPGNPKPRLFRLPADRAVVNRMGFNNDGAEAVAARLAERAPRPARRRAGARRQHRQDQGRPRGRRGAVAATTRSRARLLAPYADYLVVNVTRRTRPACATCRPSSSSQPLLSTSARAADDVTGPPGAAAGEDRPGPRRRGRARGRRPGRRARPGRDHRDQHHDLARRAAPPPQPGRGDRCRRALRAPAQGARHSR